MIVIVEQINTIFIIAITIKTIITKIITTYTSVIIIITFILIIIINNIIIITVVIKVMSTELV